MIRNVKSGIYRITNTINNNFYIGSSVDVYSRWKAHCQLLNKNSHNNIHLQRAWNLYGKGAFIFEILLECELDNILDEEQLYLDKYVGHDCCYNIAKNARAPMLGRSMSKETCYKKSIALKGKPLTNRHKQKIGRANKGNIIGEQGRLNMSVAHCGKKLTEIQKSKISKSLRGERAPLSKLTNKIVKQIRREYVPEIVSLNMLAKKYNVNKKTIQNIIQRKTWKHI